MNVNQYAMINLEIQKEAFKFQLHLPLGASWDLCESTLEEFKTAIAEMKRIAAEQAQAQSPKE